MVNCTFIFMLFTLWEGWWKICKKPNWSKEFKVYENGGVCSCGTQYTSTRLLDVTIQGTTIPVFTAVTILTWLFEIRRSPQEWRPGALLFVAFQSLQMLGGPGAEDSSVYKYEYLSEGLYRTWSSDISADSLLWITNNLVVSQTNASIWRMAHFKII
jgi:hypothetical protein